MTTQPAYPSELEAVLSRAAFDAETAPACILDADGIILAVNRAWDAFASANGGTERATSTWLLGTRWIDAIAGDDPKRIAGEALGEALATVGATPPHNTDHRMHCNAPTIRRGLEARFTPLVLSDGRVVVLIRYATLVEASLAAPAAVPPSALHAKGLIRQCSGCRRVADEAGVYRFYASIIAEQPTNVTHTMCSLCVDLWYGGGSWVE